MKLKKIKKKLIVFLYSSEPSLEKPDKSKWTAIYDYDAQGRIAKRFNSSNAIRFGFKDKYSY